MGEKIPSSKRLMEARLGQRGQASPSALLKVADFQS